MIQPQMLYLAFFGGVAIGFLLLFCFFAYIAALDQEGGNGVNRK